jgi:hypothetical protein
MGTLMNKRHIKDHVGNVPKDVYFLTIIVIFRFVDVFLLAITKYYLS